MNNNNTNYGTTQHEGVTYTITCEAWIDNNRENNAVYVAYATDDNNKKYKVQWNTTENWNKCTELCNLEQELETLRSSKSPWESENLRITKVENEIAELESEGYNSFFVEDASGACDWENANEVWEVEMD